MSPVSTSTMIRHWGGAVLLVSGIAAALAQGYAGYAALQDVPAPASAKTAAAGSALHPEPLPAAAVRPLAPPSIGVVVRQPIETGYSRAAPPPPWTRGAYRRESGRSGWQPVASPAAGGGGVPRRQPRGCGFGFG